MTCYHLPIVVLCQSLTSTDDWFWPAKRWRPLVPRSTFGQLHRSNPASSRAIPRAMDFFLKILFTYDILFSGWNSSCWDFAFSRRLSPCYPTQPNTQLRFLPTAPNLLWCGGDFVYWWKSILQPGTGYDPLVGSKQWGRNCLRNGMKNKSYCIVYFFPVMVYIYIDTK